MISLRARLGISAALVVVLVIGLSTYLQTRILFDAVEAEAVDSAAAVALGVAADLGEHSTPPSSEELVDLLADYRKAVPAVQSITVTIAPRGPNAAVASSAAPPPSQALSLAEQAVGRRDLVTFADGREDLHFVALSLERQRQAYGAVVVAVRMDALRRVRRQSRLAAAGLAGAAILLLVLGLDLVTRRFVHHPLRAVLATMARAAAGDLTARAPRARGDELGSVAEGLNAMLERMAGFRGTLRAEVEGATAELRATNRELLETAQRLFAARRALAQSQQLALAGEMAASVAHQIGTPLNVMSGYVQMLRARQGEGSAEAEQLRTVQEQIARVTTIVQSLLDQTRRPPLALVRRAPGALLAEVAELVRPALVGGGVELRLEVAPALPELAVDPGQIEQVLLNLVTNALDAMPEGGRLSLTARKDGAAVALAVVDTGIGIAPEDLPQVFEPLFTTKARGRGTGLGLPIVREIVAAHGGTVRLESRPGAGTSAIVTLPAAREGS